MFDDENISDPEEEGAGEESTEHPDGLREREEAALVRETDVRARENAFAERERSLLADMTEREAKVLARATSVHRREEALVARARSMEAEKAIAVQEAVTATVAEADVSSN